MVQARELPQKWADFFTKIYGTNEKSVAYEWQPKALPTWMETLHTKQELTPENAEALTKCSVYLMSKNGPIVICLPKRSPVSDLQPRQGEWGPHN